MVIAQEKIGWQTSPEMEPQPKKSGGPARKKVRKHLPWHRFALLILVFGIIGAIGAGRIHLSVVANSQVKALEKEIASIKTQNDIYQVEVDKLRSVKRIESAALAMGMEKPSGTMYVAGTLPDAKSQTGVQSSQAAPQVVETQPASESKGSTLKQISQFFTGFFASTQR